MPAPLLRAMRPPQCVQRSSATNAGERKMGVVTSCVCRPFQSARSLERAQTGRPPKRGETNGVDSERAEKVVCGRRVRRARDAERGGEGRVLRLEVERASAESGERPK